MTESLIKAWANYSPVSGWVLTFAGRNRGEKAGQNNVQNIFFRQKSIYNKANNLYIHYEHLYLANTFFHFLMLKIIFINAKRNSINRDCPVNNFRILNLEIRQALRIKTSWHHTILETVKSAFLIKYDNLTQKTSNQIRAGEASSPGKT